MAKTVILSARRPRAPSRHRWLPAAGLALLLVTTIALLGVWLLGQGRPQARATVQVELLALVEPGGLPPHLPLLALADYPADQVWQEPLAQGQGRAALAMWLFGPVRSDQASVEHLMQLAAAMRPRDPNGAAACLLAAADVTRLSPELNDRERAERLIAIGKELHALGLAPHAVTEWRQASILAHYGPLMPPLYRATLLHDLAVLYKQVGAARLEARARVESAQVGDGSGVLAVPERIVLDTEELPPEPAELLAARQRRRDAALAAARSLGGPAPQQAAALSALTEALSAEGLAHRGWMTEELRRDHPRAQQAALLLYHINWLQHERMLAWGAGGDGFPTWVGRRGQIEAALHEAWQALELVRLEQSIQGGVPERATLTQRDWWATRLVQARLARDPGLDVSAITASMQPNNADPAGEEMLRLDWIQARFWRVPREYVGTNQLPE